MELIKMDLNDYIETRTTEEKIENFKDRKERKIKRFEFLINKRKEQSHSAYKSSNKLSKIIPFGQPVLIGHHSEGMHRNHINKIGNLMNKSIKLEKEAEHYESCLKSVQNNNIISSDDPEAIIKLNEKLGKLEEERTQIKEFNKKARKEKKEGYASYILSNLTQNISSIKKRIIYLKQQQNIKPSVEQKGEIILIKNTDCNRIQLKFEGKPSEEKRTLLKRWGFRWSSFNGVWQRQLNNNGIYSANRVCEDIKELNLK